MLGLVVATMLMACQGDPPPADRLSDFGGPVPGAAGAPSPYPADPQGAVAACQRWQRAFCTRTETCLSDPSWQPAPPPGTRTPDGGAGDGGALVEAIEECVRTNIMKNGSCEEQVSSKQCLANAPGAAMFGSCAMEVEKQACNSLCSVSPAGFIWCWKPCLLFCP